MAVLIKTRRDGGASYASISVVAPVLASSRFRENLAPSFSFLSVPLFRNLDEVSPQLRAEITPPSNAQPSILDARKPHRFPAHFRIPAALTTELDRSPFPVPYPFLLSSASSYRITGSRLVPVLFPNREKIGYFVARKFFANVLNDDAI